nr:hypothetical protein [Tanacetum cinerariifolium]
MTSPKPKKTKKPRQPNKKSTKVPHPSESTDIAADEAVHKEGVTVWRQDTIGDTYAHTSTHDEVSTHDDVSTQDNIIQDEGIEDVGEEEVVKVVTTAKMIIGVVVDAAQVTTAIVDILVSVAETIVTTAPTITAESTRTNVEEKRRKFFAAKRTKEKRNRPPTKAQQRSLMCNYLKNMDGWKPKALKNKSYAENQELFDKAMKRINTFVDFRTELVKESSKKAQLEITQKESSKRAGDELEKCLKIFQDDVTIDA